MPVTYPPVTVSTSNQTFTGNTSVSGAFILNGVITPTSFSTAQNDYNPTGFSTATYVRLTATAATSVTGMVPTATSRVVTLVNIGSFAITLANESASSTAANRFSFGVDRTLEPGRNIQIWYDATTARWRDAEFFNKANTLIVQTGTDDEKFLTIKSVYDSVAPVTLTDQANLVANGAAGINFNVTLAGNRLLANTVNFKTGQSGRIRVTQDATGSRTLSYSSVWKFPGGAPTLTTTANATDVITYFVANSSYYECSIMKNVS